MPGLVRASIQFWHLWFIVGTGRAIDTPSMHAFDTTTGGIKVVIAEMPKLLAAVVREAVEMERDMVIVAQVDGPDALTDMVAKSADVIVTALAGGQLAPRYRDGLFGERATPVVAISTDGDSIDVYGRWVARGYGLAGLTSLIREAAAGAQPRLGN